MIGAALGMPENPRLEGNRGISLARNIRRIKPSDRFAVLETGISGPGGRVTWVAGAAPSGCGKTTFGRTILRLEEPTSGDIFFEGQNILAYDKKKMQSLRSKMQIIFQDPFSSLNPRKTVSHIIGEPLLVHGTRSRHKRDARVLDLLTVVGLRKEHMRRYPHQFSGGQRQRIGVARALALSPHFILLDEPFAGVDPIAVEDIQEIVSRLKEKNIGILITDHHNAPNVTLDPGADPNSDQVACMRGRESAREALSNPSSS